MIDELRKRQGETALRVHEAADAVEAAGDDADLDALKADLNEAIADAERAKSAVADAETRAEARAAFPKPDPAEPTNRKLVGDVKVGREERTYKAETKDEAETAFHRFAMDAMNVRYGYAPQDATERVQRSQREFKADYRAKHGFDLQQRDVATSAFAGLVIPQYLVDLVAPNASAGRPYLNTVRKFPLPDAGTVMNISRITTATSAAAQSADNAAVSETDIDDTLLAVNVRTYAGLQDLSRQTVERGTGTWEVTLDDLLRRYYAANDNGAINSDGTSGTHLSVRSTGSIETVTYTDASPTVAEFYYKVADAAQRINSNCGDQGHAATHALMHPRRWGWINGASDSTGRPLVVPAPMAMNAVAAAEAQGYGVLPYTLGGTGLRIVTSSAIPTNIGAGTEDVVIVYCADEQVYMEQAGHPAFLRFEDVGSGTLTIRMVVYGYSAFSAGRRPNSNAVITGTGLIAPTF